LLATKIPLLTELGDALRLTEPPSGSSFVWTNFFARRKVKIMKKNDIIGQWSSALDSGSFLTAKHDPTGLSIAWDSFRTVLSSEASSSLAGYIKSGDYGIRAFEDKKFPSSSGFFEIVPSGSSPFSVAGSGVASGSITPSGSYDRLVVAYAKKDGWHVYAENSARISSSVADGRLVLKHEL